MIDLRPATARVAEVIDGITDDQLEEPTPCTDTSVREMLNHLLGLTVAFRDAAGKVEGPTTSTPPTKVSSALPDDWRDRLHAQLDEVAQAWSDPRAWEGMTMAGGVRFPAQAAGLVTLNEVQMHGWDLAPEYSASPAGTPAGLPRASLRLPSDRRRTAGRPVAPVRLAGCARRWPSPGRRCAGDAVETTRTRH